jgi:hypothetical protein
VVKALQEEKRNRTAHWNSLMDTNSSGFTGLPGGYRTAGAFSSIGNTVTGGVLRRTIRTPGTAIVFDGRSEQDLTNKTFGFQCVASGINTLAL